MVICRRRREESQQRVIVEFSLTPAFSRWERESYPPAFAES